MRYGLMSCLTIAALLHDYVSNVGEAHMWWPGCFVQNPASKHVARPAPANIMSSYLGTSVCGGPVQQDPVI